MGGTANMRGGALVPGRAVVLTHGGAGHLSAHADGAERACAAALRALAAGAEAIDAAVEATVVLEDDPRFNAGTSSVIRIDGRTIQMDACVMDDAGRLGAIAAVEGIRNPVRVARLVCDSPHRILVGEGAMLLARAAGVPLDHDPETPEVRARIEKTLVDLRDGTGDMPPSWRTFDWRPFARGGPAVRASVPAPTHPATDTVGAVVLAPDGHRAAALSTGGTCPALVGRVGDVPIPGAGLWVGRAAAVCVTGHGDRFIDRLLAREMHDRLAAGADLDALLRDVLTSFEVGVHVGALVITPTRWMGGSNLDMPWAAATA